jgi:hypothetical protein
MSTFTNNNKNRNHHHYHADLSRNQRQPSRTISWPGALWFNNQRSNNNTDEPYLLDLVRFLDPIIYFERGEELPPVEFPNKMRYMFPEERFLGADDTLKLVVELKVAAIRSGYNLTIRSSQSHNSKTSGDREKTIHFACCSISAQRQLQRRQNKKKSSSSTAGDHCKSNNTKSISANEINSHNADNTDDKTCEFSFTIFLQKDSASKRPGRWFLATASSTRIPMSQTHCCHKRSSVQLQNWHVHVQALPPEELELARNCCQLYHTESSSMALKALRDPFVTELLAQVTETYELIQDEPDKLVWFLEGLKALAISIEAANQQEEEESNGPAPSKKRHKVSEDEA